MKSRGFTIVELLIVIVVIAILAAISVVAYNGIQQRARDTQRKNDLAAYAKALHLYNVDNGNYMSSGNGCSAGSGWVHYPYSGLNAIDTCLVSTGYLQKELKDPKQGCATIVESPLREECFYYMKYDCGGTTYLYANLETMPNSYTDLDGVGCQEGLDHRYGMNYYVKVN